MKFAIIFALFTLTSARIYTRCELARLFYKIDFMRERLGDWLCIVEHESSYNTSVIGSNTANPHFKTSYFGLFQIGDDEWCSSLKNPTNNKCEIGCSRLLGSELTDDFQCVLKMYSEKGFDAWPTWKQRCHDRDLNGFFEDCFNIPDEVLLLFLARVEHKLQKAELEKKAKLAELAKQAEERDKKRQRHHRGQRPRLADLVSSQTSASVKSQ